MGDKISPTCTGSLLKVKNGAKRTRSSWRSYGGGLVQARSHGEDGIKNSELKSLRNSRDGKQTKA